MRYAFVILALIPAVGLAGDQPMAIRNVAVETLTSTGRVERATVIIRDGKIASIGQDVAIPGNATIIDGAGGTLMPGVIDPYFQVPIAAATPGDAAPRAPIGRGRGRGGFQGGFGRGAGGAFTRVADNFYAHDAAFKPLPRVGLTRLNLVTTGDGQSAVIRLTPNSPESMLENSDGLAYVSVTNSTDSLDQVRNRLQSGARAAGGNRTGGFAATPSTDSQLWVDVVEGKTPLLAQTTTAAAVLHLLKATEQYKNVKLVLFITGDAIVETLPELKDRKVRVIVRPNFELLPNTRDRFNPARMLDEAGIDFTFSLTARPAVGAPGAGRFGAGPNPADAETTPPLSIDQEFPLFPVAMLVKTGLPRRIALEALSKRPAIMLGIEKSHGTIEGGKSADLLLFSGDPFDPESRLRRTIIDGRTVYAN
jgi:hypothetical protein